MSETCRFIPDIQSDEVGPWEDVVTTENHSDVCHQDILQEGHIEQTLESAAGSFTIYSKNSEAHLDAADNCGG